MKEYPGVSRFVVRYVIRRGRHKGIEVSYPYYKARIWIGGRMKHLGNYATAEEAAATYAKAKSSGATIAN